MKAQFTSYIGVRKSLGHPGFNVVIYTIDGQDPMYPIVGEIVSALSECVYSTTPAKWSPEGRYYAYGDVSSVSMYDLPIQDWSQDEAVVLKVLVH
jgi:hypothetical protein